MQITEIGLHSREKLINVLSAGFPQRSVIEWSAFFDRVNRTLTNKDLPQSTDGQGPLIGWLLGSPETPDGILLGLPNPISELTQFQRPRQVNLSSWFVKEERRAQAIWMLRKISNLPGYTFTDVTPSEAVARMLPSLGYSKISQGAVRLYTPQAMFVAQGRWRIVNSEQLISRQTDPLLVQALQDHLALGCLVAGLDLDGQCLAVVLKRKASHRGIRTVEVIHLPPPDACPLSPRLGIPAIARWLATRGIFQLDIEIPVDDRLTVPMYQRIVSDRPRFARGPYPAGGISHLYSELAYGA